MSKLADAPNPVCALLILRDEGLVLYAVRDSASNSTFPDTISIPTQRMPPALAQDLLGDLEVQVTDAEETFFAAAWKQSNDSSGHSSVIYAVDSILATKLGASALLELGELSYSAAVTSRTIRTARHANLLPDEGQVELVDMITITVNMTGGADLVPTRTPTYRHIGWTPRERFSRAVWQKDPLLLVPESHPAEICVQGVCTYAAARLLDRMRDL